MALKMKKFLSDLVSSPRIRPWQEKLILIIQFFFEKVFVKKVFLEISQNSQESPVPEFLFFCNFIKKETVGCFCPSVLFFTCCFQLFFFQVVGT